MENIKPKAILLYYDYPQVFIGVSIVDQNYCCMVVSEDENGPQYLCTPISNKRTTELTSGKLDLRIVYEEPESKTFFLTNWTPDSDQICLKKQDFSTCPEYFLPKTGLVFDDFDEVANKALELNATVTYASLSVVESENYPRINSLTLASFLQKYQNVVKQISKHIAKNKQSKSVTGYSLDVFGFSYGSFTVQLRSSYDGDLFGDSPLISSALEKLTDFLEHIDNTDYALNFLHTVKGHTASSIIKFVEFLDEHKCPFKQQWATPSSGASKDTKVSLTGIKQLIELCHQQSDLLEETVILTGVVQSANIKGNTWKLLNEDDGIQYSGDVAEGKNISMSGIVIQKQRYTFKCIERIDVNVGTGIERTHLSVLEIMES